MNKIKFSHKYSKLNFYDNDLFYTLRKLPKQARLLEIFKCHYRDLNEYFIDYDTAYGFDVDCGFRRYKLPKVDLMILLFMNRTFKGELFTTIRRYTPEKYEYYKSKIGGIFEVVIKEDLIEKKLD